MRRRSWETIEKKMIEKRFRSDMSELHPILRVLSLRKQGIPAGVYSACTANRHVIRAVCDRAKATGTVALVEATANQVNRYGGYTGMTPSGYMAFVRAIADEAGLDPAQLVLGGDHLGPLTWQNLPEAEAMVKAEELVRDYVAAGFTKIHVDTSMRVADDSRTERLSDETIARRGAFLVHAAEEEFAALKRRDPDAVHPIYCIGSEVPIPGGAQQAEDSVAVTSPEAFRHCVDTFKAAFEAAGVGDSWQYVTGVVVQPGVEFGDVDVIEYDPAKAVDLIAALASYDNIVFEGHSTDYQTKYGLRDMVRDGIAILKVGPALTFALREGLFALNIMEQAMLPQFPELTPSGYAETLETVMMDSDANWKKYYRGTPAQTAFKRKYSYSDRCRYYLPDPRMNDAETKLLENLKTTGIPLSLLSQYMPIQYTKVREGVLPCTPEALLLDRIANCIDEYLFAVMGK